MICMGPRSTAWGWEQSHHLRNFILSRAAAFARDSAWALSENSKRGASADVAVSLALLRMLALGRKQIEEGKTTDHDAFFAELEREDGGWDEVEKDANREDRVD